MSAIHSFAIAVMMLFAHSVCAADVAITRVDVFVDDLSPIAAGAEAKALESSGALTLWNLDDLERFNTRMAQDLPRDLARAKETLAARIHAMTPAEVAALSHAATGSARAEGFHVGEVVQLGVGAELAAAVAAKLIVGSQMPERVAGCAHLSCGHAGLAHAVVKAELAG